MDEEHIEIGVEDLRTGCKKCFFLDKCIGFKNGTLTQYMPNVKKEIKRLVSVYCPLEKIIFSNTLNYASDLVRILDEHGRAFKEGSIIMGKIKEYVNIDISTEKLILKIETTNNEFIHNIIQCMLGIPGERLPMPIVERKLEEVI